MWKQGACLALIAGVLFACSGGGGGGDWYKRKSPPSVGAAGMGSESAGQSGVAASERPDGSGGSAGSGAEEQ